VNYNLLEEKWIPVLRSDGQTHRVGIREALTQAGRIRQIAASNPMDRVAIVRFLLAVLYWCKGNPPDDTSANLADLFPADWFSKLDENKECFNLLGEQKRFYQYREQGDEPLTASYLIHEIPTGTNAWHFRHATDKRDGLCLACCAMGLLRLPLFATSAGRGKSPGINAKPPLYVIPVGKSLAATLRLSWWQVSDLGTPAWEAPNQPLPEDGEVPFLLGLTWLPRRVWLDDPEKPKGNCISCGRSDRIIRMCVFAGIGSTRAQAGRTWRDPHVVYEQSSKGDSTSLHGSNALGAADAAAGQWTKIVAGILGGQRANDVSSAWVVGFSTVQNDKYLEAMEWLIPFPYSAHHDQASIAKFERWQKEGSNLVRKLRSLCKEKLPRKHIEIPPVLSAIRPHVEGRVSTKMGELLAGGDNAWERAASEYRPMMEMIAQSLSPGSTAAAVQRRKQIANVLPDMRPKTESGKKPGRKNGGDK